MYEVSYIFFSHECELFFESFASLANFDRPPFSTKFEGNSSNRSFSFLDRFGEKIDQNLRPGRGGRGGSLPLSSSSMLSGTGFEKFFNSSGFFFF